MLCATADHVIEHERDIRLDRLKKPGLAEHCLVKGHQPDFGSASFGSHIILESIANHLESQTVNRDTGFNLSICWRPSLRLLGN